MLRHLPATAWRLAGATLLPTATQAPPAAVLQAPAARATDLPPTLAALDSANGFGAYRFGTPVAELPEPLAGLVVLKHDQVAFVAPGAAANIGGLLLPSVSLTAYAGRLSRICLGPTSEQYAETLLHTLQRCYGPGRHADFMRYVWPGQVVTLVYEPLVTTIGHGHYMSSRV